MGQGASTYDSVRFTTRHGLAFDELERDQLMRAATMVPAGGSVLEVGCGTARFAKRFAEAGYKVTASDASPDMLNIAREKCVGLPNIEFKLAEGASVGFASDEFDFVFAIRVMNSLESPHYALQTVREMIRVTKPGGVVLVEFANGNRPLAKQNNSVRLTFRQLSNVAAERACSVLRKSGVLVFSQTVLNAVPAPLLPFWVSVERALASVLWGVTSRGYIVLRKGKTGLSMAAEYAIFVTEAYYTKSKLYGVSGHVQIPLKAACLMAERAGRIDLITTKPSGAEHLMVDTPGGLQIELLTHATKEWPESGVYVTRAIRQFVELQRLVARKRYKVVHFFGGPKTGVLAAITKVLSRDTRIIYSPISAPVAANGAIASGIRRALFNKLDLVVSTTAFVSREWASALRSERVDVIKPGILKRMKHEDAGVERDSVVYWRNADYENGADLMLAAVRELAPRHPSIRFVFAIRAGSEFQDAALDLQREVSNVVTYVQPYENGLTIERILSRALFVVAPFRRLSINPQMSILETLYAGVPVIASDIESNREVVIDGVTGLLIEPDDSDSIVRAVDRLLGDRTLLDSLTGNAESTTRASHNWDDFGTRLTKIYGI